MQAIIVGLIGAVLSLGAIMGYAEYEQSLGALPLIQSAQLAASPSNGECLTTNGTVNDWITCASGGGGGGGFWATTTNNLIIYPTSDTYTVSIGANATTSSEFWFDPNTSRSKIPYASTTMITATTASSTSLIVSGLNAASCDVKSSTAGVLSCGTDATGGSSDYDAWTHPGSGISATTSQIIISASSTIGDGSVNGGLTVNGTATTSRHIVVRGTATSTIAGNLNFAASKKLVFGAATNDGGSIMNWNEKGSINFLGDSSASGKLSFSALGNGLHASHNFFSFAAESGSAGTGAWNGILLNVTQTATPSGTKNLINLQTDSTSQFSVSSAGTASTTNLIVSGLNAASCDVKASTAGVLSCGTDATGAGGSTPDSKWATSTDFAIYPSGNTPSIVLGRTTQLGRNCLSCFFATSTAGDLLFASSTFGFDGNFVRFVDSSAATMFAVNGNGNADIAGNLEVTSYISSLASVNSPSYFLTGSGGFSLTNTAFGKITLAAGGGTHDENLTLALDDAANTAVWSSSTGVTTIDWAAFNLTTTGTVTAGALTVTPLTSAIMLTNGSGVFAEYAGSTCTNQAVTAISALGVATCTTLTTAYIADSYLLNNGDVGTGNYDFGGATFFEIPNGTAPTADDVGEIAHDTTDNQLIVDDFVIQTTERIWGVTIASTSPAFVSAGLLPIPNQLDGYTVTRYQCHVTSGTSKVIAVEDASANSSEDITCATTNTTDDGSITNATFTASELGYIDFGATSGAVDYVTIEAFGTWTRE